MPPRLSSTDRGRASWRPLSLPLWPGVSLSAGIISTDVPLLAAWAAALAFFIALVRGAGWWAAVGLGVALGVGLNAKYAMAYFLVCLTVYAIAVPSQRRLLADARIWLAIAIGAAFIVPNIMWNLENGFATVSHTADNANWGGRVRTPGKGPGSFSSASSACLVRSCLGDCFSSAGARGAKV